VTSNGELQSSIAANTDNRQGCKLIPQLDGQASSIISCRQPCLPPSRGVRHNLLSSDRAL
ncbi:uncharacterized protein B0T23DRAFT_313862, partial [Neurospora hispaniola]